VTTGAKLSHSRLVGFPFTVVVGKRHDSGALEVLQRADNATLSLTVAELVALARRQ